MNGQMGGPRNSAGALFNSPMPDRCVPEEELVPFLCCCFINADIDVLYMQI